MSGKTRKEQLQEMLADDVQPGIRQQVMDIGHPAGDGIFDRDHRVARIPTLDDRQRVLECRARERLEIGQNLAAGEMRVGAGFALVGDARAG